MYLSEMESYTSKLDTMNSSGHDRMEVPFLLVSLFAVDAFSSTVRAILTIDSDRNAQAYVCGRVTRDQRSRNVIDTVGLITFSMIAAGAQNWQSRSSVPC